MIEKPWLKSYPAGMPEFADTDAYQSIVEVFDESVKQFGDRTAFYSMGATLTYRQLDVQAQIFADWLISEAKLTKGDRIAVMMPNLLQYPVVVFGALRAGLTVVNTNPLYTERELKHQLHDSVASAIVIVENFAHTLADIIDEVPLKTVITTRIGDFLGFPKSVLVNSVVKYVKKMVPAFSLPGSISLNQVLKHRSSGVSMPTIEPSDLAFLQYTGGTTGVSKGAMLSHRNMVANMQQSHQWLATREQSTAAEIIITALPLYHIFALTANCLVYSKLGACNVLILNPRDMPGFVKELSKHKFTAITGVNTLFNALLNTPGFDKVDFSNLKVTLGGGMAVQEFVAREWKKITGCPLIEAYGLTETSPAACINPLDLPHYNGTIGLPLPSTDACLRDDDGNAVEQDQPGELCIRGPQVMAGYWQRPEATAEVLDADGWLRTGDIATMDADGFLRIVDRKKDMILVSGFNVFPNEIENVLVEHPGILEVGAIGIPDDHSGEVVKVYIVAKDKSLTIEDVESYCRENFTGYKRPKAIVFVEELPKSNVGKILRRELRELDA